MTSISSAIHHIFLRAKRWISSWAYERRRTFFLYSHIDRGAFACVMTAIDDGDVTRAVKVQDVSAEEEDAVLMVAREWSALVAVRGHPNWVRAECFHFREEGGTLTSFVVMEKLSHSLSAYISRVKGKWSPRKAKIAADVVVGVSYLHSLRLLHCDIKPSNVLLDADGRAKLCDLGLCCREEDPRKNTYVITKWYRPPELLSGCNDYTRKADAWSVGCTVAHLYKGTPLFAEATDSGMLSQIRLRVGDAWARADTFSRCAKGDPICFELLSHLLVVEERERSSAESVQSLLVLSPPAYHRVSSTPFDWEAGMRAEGKEGAISLLSAASSDVDFVFPDSGWRKSCPSISPPRTE